MKSSRVGEFGRSTKKRVQIQQAAPELQVQSDIGEQERKKKTKLGNDKQDRNTEFTMTTTGYHVRLQLS